MKKLLLLFFLFAFLVSSFAQDIKKEQQTQETKIDAFTSKTGVLIKYRDYKLTPFKLVVDAVETRVRKISTGIATSYFYQITKEGKYGDVVGSIEYSDLIEVIKAINSLISSANGDVASNPEYLENKFSTVDGLQVGYYVDKGKANWYVRLQKYGTDTNVFVSDPMNLLLSFEAARNKIDDLKKG